jgi:hypothetical protein
MSFRVLIIPEDPIYNGFILRPLGEKIMRELGKTNARIEVLTNPKLSGFEHAKSQLDAICERYNHYDLILFLPDRDGKQTRDAVLEKITERLQEEGYPFIATAAIEEVEAWLLAGHKTSLKRNWVAIRGDAHIKENDFLEFINEYGDDGPGQGRERLMRKTLRNFSGLCQTCSELRRLTSKIRQLLNQNEQ